MKLNYAIVFVNDMNRSVAFYRDVVGIPLRFESPGWTEFATEGATLALHAAEGPQVEPDNPHQVPGGRCRPGFGVANLDDFHKKMLDHHVTCVEEPKSVFGARIAQYVDPDGLPISVSEQRRG